MTPFSSLIYAEEGITLKEANDMIWDHKLNCLPVIDKNQNLVYMVSERIMTATRKTRMNCWM
jgi:IMP dehydrogenase